MNLSRVIKKSENADQSLQRKMEPDKNGIPDKEETVKWLLSIRKERPDPENAFLAKSRFSAYAERKNLSVLLAW